jgi:hypothetical protein
MTTATRTPKAPKHMSRVRNVAVRTCRVLARDAHGHPAALRITVGFEKTDYAVDATPEGDGMAYTLTKDGGEVYGVRISEATGNSCTCPGGTYRGKCKHVSSLLSIAARDQQKPRPAMVCRDVFDCHNDE